MTDRLRRLLPIKPGEGFITAVMFSYIFGVLFFYYVLDPIRKGLFLQNFPAAHLPYAYFLTAAIAGTTATLVFKLSRRWPAITILTAINLAIIGTLFYFRWAMGRDIWYLPYVYFFYVKTVSVLSTAQFWLLAGYVYDSRQAKRVYGFLGMGAILGAIAGSTVPAFLSAIVSLQSMVMICIAICAVLILLSQVAWRHRRPDSAKQAKPVEREKPRDRFTDIWPAIFGSPHLRLMAALIFFALIATQIADWQVDASAQMEFGGDSFRIREFTGRLSFYTNIIALFVQVFLTNFLINRGGVFTAITILPAGLFLSSSGFLLFPSLITASLARASDTVFRYSLNRAGLEMLYLPLPPSVRTRLKLFVDVFVDRAGRAVAGVVILLLTSSYFPFGPRGTAAVAMGLTFLCLVICFKLGRTYVNAFRQQLARREVELGDVSHYVRDPAAVQLLVGALEGKNERRILYALQLLQSVRKVDFSEQLLPLFSHPSPHVREAAVRTLQALPRDYSAEAMRMLEDVSGGVRLAAVGYLCSNEFGGSVATLESLLEHPRVEIRIAAAQWAADNPMPGFQPSMELVDALCAVQGPQAVEARATAAALGSLLPRDDSKKLLSRLLDDPDPEVTAAAAKAAGTAGHLNLVFEVANFLTVGKTRSVGRAGLLCYGERIVGTLGDLLADRRGGLALRRQIPWVLSRIPVQESVDTLADQLSSEDSTIRLRCAKALNRLHETSLDLKMPSSIIDRSVRDEIRAYYETLAMSRTFDSPGDSDQQRGLLQRALHERMDQRLEMIFRLLGLEHNQRDIYFAYLALKGKLGDRRTAAIEFLDNVLHRDLKPLVLPLLEESNPDALLQRATRLFGIQSSHREEALKRLLAQSDNWLKSCALHEIGRSRIKELAESCRTLSNEKDLVVKQTATWALARCAGDPTDDDH